MESTNDKFLKILSKLQNELSSGLLYTHTRINDNTRKTLEATSFLYALIELLNENGLLSIEELDEGKGQMGDPLCSLENINEGGNKCLYRCV